MTDKNRIAVIQIVLQTLIEQADIFLPDQEFVFISVAPSGDRHLGAAIASTMDPAVQLPRFLRRLADEVEKA